MKSNQLGDLDQVSLEYIVSKAKKLASIITSLVLGTGLILKSSLTSHLVSMKLLAIFVIIYRSAYQNFNNDVSLYMIMYMYSTGAKIDTITVFNYPGLFILYKLVLKKLRSIITSSATSIKKEASNCKLISM